MPEINSIANTNIAFQKEIKWESPCPQSSAELLLGFFDFYLSVFNHAEATVDIHAGGISTKKQFVEFMKGVTAPQAEEVMR